MRHIPPLEELKVKFETPTSKTVLEQATLTKISQRIDELVQKQAELKEEKGSRKRANEVAPNVNARKIKKTSSDQRNNEKAICIYF